MAPAQSLDDDELASLLSLLEAEQTRAHLLMNVVIPIGVKLVYETDFDRLLERILMDAMNLCNADGGALYLRTGEALRPAIIRTDSLGVAWGGTTGKPVPDLSIPLIDPETQAPCRKSIAAQAAATGEIVNVPDVAELDGFQCVEIEDFQRKTGYLTRSCLALPLRNSAGLVIGVVELANARRTNGEISPFEPGIQQVVESLCLIASAALESYIRQQKLKDQVREMSIQVDEAKKAKQVSAILETDYFKNLRARARDLRSADNAAP